MIEARQSRGSSSGPHKSEPPAVAGGSAAKGEGLRAKRQRLLLRSYRFAPRPLYPPATAGGSDLALTAQSLMLDINYDAGV